MNEEKKSVGELMGTALISFIATNTDDLVVLMNFFTEATMSNSSMKVHHIFIGQYLGFIILLGFSLIGYSLSYAIPIQMLGFLGFFPIILGIKGFIEIIIELYEKSNLNINEIIANDELSTTELDAIRHRNDINGEILSGIRIEQGQQNLIVINSSSPRFKQKLVILLSHCFNLQILKVASVTLANSGDNIAIYTPLFAQAYGWQIAIYIIIFLFMVFVWLISSYFFINFRPILSLAQKYAKLIVPFVFIGLGIYIIVTSDCFPWLIKAIQTNNFKAG